jgi:hypothetical protein
MLILKKCPAEGGFRGPPANGRVDEELDQTFHGAHFPPPASMSEGVVHGTGAGSMAVKVNIY